MSYRYMRMILMFDMPLRHNVIPANEAVKEIVKHKIGLFMNLESPINLGNK
ncbi:hypothetical protein OKI_04695 [Enterococcus faecium EnGen0038]|nr:hypothetical protein OKI_04695 [Enterococcus faecium EnGen0038]